MKKIFMVLIVLIFGLCLPVFTFAEMPEENLLPPDTLMPGMIEGAGNHFEVTNSEYLNIVLDSSESITLRLESIPEMVTMHIESASEAASTQITVSGFQPSTTYYKYEDNYHNLNEFTTDKNGSYSYTQDISTSHFVFIQPRKSTKFINDNATGGDCTSIGAWDSVTKTCTLTTDVNETIQIDSNYITLDGNGHAITGTGTGHGVYLYGKTRVTMKNLNVKNFQSGISLFHSSNNTFTGNTVSNNGRGILLGSNSNNNTLTGNTVLNNGSGIFFQDYCSNNTLTGNTVLNNGWGILLQYFSNNNTLTSNTTSNNAIGIYLDFSSNNTLTDNTAQENSAFDLYVQAGGASDCNNIIQNTTGSGGRPIKYFNSSVNVENEILSELILCNADYSNINNVTIDGSETLRNNGLILVRTDYSNITNINSSNNDHGIYLWYSSSNTLIDNTTANNYNGIYLWYSSNNVLTDNTASKNGSHGIWLYPSNNNTITGNTISNNYVGIYLGYSDNNRVYNNNFIDNQWQQGYVYVSRGNIFNLEKPVGGNYWSDFDTPAEGCYDTNNDGFCDAPYYFTGGVDYLPWARQRGWEVPADTIPPTTTAIRSGILGDNGWYISNVQVTLTATDNEGGSGVKKIEYSFDGIIWNTYSVSFTISNQGTTIVYYKSTDNAGNVETTKSISVKIDKTAPSTSAIISGTSGSNGWYVSDVTIELTATDTVSGVKTINYSINGATNTVSGNRTSFTLTTDGRYTITYYAVDNAGKIEAQKSMDINIDRTAPSIITVTATPNILWPPNHKMVDVLIDGSATDDMSGIASIIITVTDEYGIYNMTVPSFGSTIQLEAWREGTDRDGRHYTITVVVTDVAGNQSTATAQVIVSHDMRK